MLTFFRKIRKTLLGSGATRKYLLYAVGETLLVVVGILIALQINNWNEWRKERIAEEKILKELISNIEQNCSQLEESLRDNEGRNQSSEVVFDLLANKPPYVDTIDKHFFGGALRAQIGVNIAQNSYQAFKNVGFDKVSNDSLRQRIVFLFEEIYQLTEKWASYNNEYAVNDINIWYKYFVREGTNLTPLDYRTVLESSEVYSFYQSVQVLRNISVRYLKQSLVESQHVLMFIKEELGESDE